MIYEGIMTLFSNYPEIFREEEFPKTHCAFHIINLFSFCKLSLLTCDVKVS